MAPGAGIMGFDMIKDVAIGENFFRAHMVVNNTFKNPTKFGGIPFMSIGAQQGRGNSSRVTTINDPSSPKNVIWTSKLWARLDPGGSNTTHHMLVITAMWGGIPHQIQLLLFHPNYDASFFDVETRTFSIPGENFKWNWPAKGSFWYPGADIAFMDAEDATYGCPGVSVPAMTVVPSERTYSLNVGNLMRCASDHGLFNSPMPSVADVPVTGIHWANEVAGVNAALWVSVHGMKMQ